MKYQVMFQMMARIMCACLFAMKDQVLNHRNLPIAYAIDLESSYTFLTPNGMKVSCPTSGFESKPANGVICGSWSDVLNMYKNCAEKSRFFVRVGQTNKNKK
ncbi:hypothetical protein R6Q59_035453 [Mikania micrantha]